MFEDHDEFVLRAFVDAIHEVRDNEEFERLMHGKERGLREQFKRLDDGTDCMWITNGLWEDASALTKLKADRSLERLKVRFPEIWERVEVEEAGIGA